MNEPASLWDVGILRLRLDLSEQRQVEKRPGEQRGVSVDYDCDTNRLRLSTVVQQAYDFGRIACGAELYTLRQDLFVDPETGEPRSGFEHSLLSSYFRHQFYTVRRKDADIASELDNIAVVHAVLFRDGKTVECHGPLLGTDVFFKEAARADSAE